MRDHITAPRGWALIAVIVAAHDLLARDGEYLSHGMDRFRARRPILAHLVVAVTALHLTRRIPPALDPFVWALKIRTWP